MPPEVRQRMRKLAQRMCTKAAMYKGVNLEACVECESPCGYGVEALSVAGLELPKPETEEKIYPKAGTQAVKGIKRMFGTYNRGGVRH